jgi:hypothetical protein
VVAGMASSAWTSLLLSTSLPPTPSSSFIGESLHIPCSGRRGARVFSKFPQRIKVFVMVKEPVPELQVGPGTVAKT